MGGCVLDLRFRSQAAAVCVSIIRMTIVVASVIIIVVISRKFLFFFRLLVLITSGNISLRTIFAQRHNEGPSTDDLPYLFLPQLWDFGGLFAALEVAQSQLPVLVPSPVVQKPVQVNSRAKALHALAQRNVSEVDAVVPHVDKLGLSKRPELTLAPDQYLVLVGQSCGEAPCCNLDDVV